MLIKFRICSWRSSPQPCFLTTSSICCGCVMRGEHGLDTYVACRTMQCSHGRQKDSWSSQLCLMMQAAAAWTHCSSMGLPSLWDSTSAYCHKDFYRGSTHPIQPANCRLSSIAALWEATPHSHRAKRLHDRAGMMDAMQSCLCSSACMTCTPHL